MAGRLNDMNTYDLHQFKSDLHELNIILDEKQISQFIKYYELLVEWNSFMNLTAITDYEEILKKHFIDSLCFVKAYSLEGNGKAYHATSENASGKQIEKEWDSPETEGIKLIDIGTGAGFPGIPLKIAFPHLKITLLDSLQKRVKFLDEVITKLGLHGIEAVHGRAEDYAKPGKLREKYDLAVSRAVANLSTLSEYCIPFVKKDGKFICYKSEKVSEELVKAEKAIAILGGKIEGKVDYTLPFSDIYRNLIIIQKVKATPVRFPRKAGIPSKEPIL